MQMILTIHKLHNKEEGFMEDKEIVCKDCGKTFVFTVGEQNFYKEKGFEHEPVRCPDCRKARKARMEQNKSAE